MSVLGKVPARMGFLLSVVAMVIAAVIVVKTVRAQATARRQAQIDARVLERQELIEARRQEDSQRQQRWEEAERVREEEWTRAEEASKRREAELAKAIALEPPQKQRRRKRFTWLSPAEARAQAWNVPDADYDEAEATALLRIFINEADGQENDSKGIWQVIRTIRSGSCDRSYRRRITDCEEVERFNGKLVWRETLLSAMKRMSRAVVDDIITPKNRRQAWTSTVELNCERPAKFPGNEKMWRFQYGVRCPRRAELARKLVSGEEDVDLVEGVRLIAWGGRCRPGQACDNIHACRRGLAMVETDTHNAFWCRPGTRGCPADVDPICRQYMRLPDGMTHPALIDTRL